MVSGALLILVFFGVLMVFGASPAVPETKIE